MDLVNLLSKLQAIKVQEDLSDKQKEIAKQAGDPDKIEGEDFAKLRSKKIDEYGDMEMSPLTNPSAGYDMEPMAAMTPQAEPEMAHQEEKPMYTLTVRNGENNLSMTTDAPEEIIHVMKLAGVKGQPEVKKTTPEQPGQEKAVDEAWANTPEQTNETEPTAYGDIRDWGFKGTGKGREGYGDRRAPGQGDNPLSENDMIAEYKQFKLKK